MIVLLSDLAPGELAVWLVLVALTVMVAVASCRGHREEQ